MDKLSLEKQVNGSREKSISKAAAGVTGDLGKQMTDVNTELMKINRTLTQLEVELIFCNKQIDNNLERREDLIQQFCLLISIFEKNLMLYDQAQHTRRKFEELLNVADVDFEINENQEIFEEIHEIQDDVVRTKRQVHLIWRMCAHVEPHLKLQKVENEVIHANLCIKLGKIEQSRQEAIAKRKQLLKARNSIKEDK